MSEWQPIETAPKDGTNILIFWENKYEFGFASVVWAKMTKEYGYWYPYGVGGYEMESDWETKDVTHWMPLPEPPKK